MGHTSYEFINVPAGLIEGQRASMRPKAVRAGTNLSMSLTIPFGRAIILPAATSGVIELPSAAGQNFGGITFFETIYEQIAGSDPGVGPQRQGDYIVEGDIAVFCETAVTDLTDGVFFRHTANGAGKDVIGRFRTDADTATCDAIDTSIAKWLYLSAANSLNVLHISVS